MPTPTVLTVFYAQEPTVAMFEMHAPSGGDITVSLSKGASSARIYSNSSNDEYAAGSYHLPPNMYSVTVGNVDADSTNDTSVTITYLA